MENKEKAFNLPASVVSIASLKTISFHVLIDVTKLYLETPHFCCV